MVTQTFKLPASLAAQLASEAKARRVAKSVIVRELIEKHFAANGRKRRVTFGDLAGHLAGSGEGPRDLSTNPKYMEGFGG